MSEDYRTRVRALRAEAHQRILQLRSERLGAARRSSPGGRRVAAALRSAPAPATTAPAMSEAVDVKMIAVSGEVAALARELAPVAAVDAEAVCCEAATLPSHRPTSATAHQAPDRERMPADADPDGTQEDVAPEVGLATPAEPRDHDACGLSIGALPGVGPGLVWMLAEAGVRSIDDLLRSDPASLSDRLGLVGRLIDVARLQRLAAELQGDGVSV